MTIKTKHEYNSRPPRHDDWTAIDDERYEPHHPIGCGSTERLAIINLLEQIRDNTNDEAYEAEAVAKLAQMGITE